MATQAQKEAFRLKWHRARMYEQGLSRAAVQRKIAEMQKAKKLPQNRMLAPADLPAKFRPKAKPKADNRSPYRKWASQEWKNTKPGQRVAAPDNGKSPWRNFTDNGGAKRIADAMDLGHAERQERYKKRRISKEAIQRRLKAQRNQKNTTGR